MPGRARDAIVARLTLTLHGRTGLYHVFELWVGLAGMINGIVFFYSPATIHQNVIAVTVGYPAAAVWNSGYFLAGIGVWYGLLRPAPRSETVALWLLGIATSVNGVAVLAVFGLRGAATAFMLIALTAASWLRAMKVQVDALRLVEKGPDDAS